MKVKKLEEKALWQWKWMEYLSYAIVFLAPLYFNVSHLFPFSSPKVFITSFFVLLMVILYAWGAIVSKSFSIRITALHIVLGIFLLVITISSIFGVDPYNSFFGAFNFSTNLIFIYIVALFAVFIGFLIRNNKQFLPNILLFSFLSGVIVSFFSYSGNSIFKIITDYGSTTGNSSYTGAYLLFNVCFGLGLFVYYQKYWKKILIALGTLFILFCPLFFNIGIFTGKVGLSQIISNPILVLGVANGAALGVGISFLFIFIFYLIFSSKKSFKIIGVILLFIFLSGLVYTSYVFMDPTSKIHNVYVQSKGENRFVAWDIAKQGINDRPILGAGFNNYYYNFQKYFPADIYKTNSEFFFQSHNVVLEYASNNGILGLISYLSLLSFAFLALFKYKKEDVDNMSREYKMFSIVCIGILFGYFIQNLFVFDTVTTYLMFFLIVGVALGLSSSGWKWEFKSIIFRNIIAVVVILVSLTSIILFVILPWQESTKWRKVVFNNNLKELSILRNGLQEISLFGGVDDSTYVATKLFNFYVSNINEVNDSNRKLFLDGIDSLIAQVERDQLSQPPNFKASLIIGKLLSLRMYIVGKLDEDTWDKANDYLDKTLHINDQSPEVYLAKAQLYISKKDYSQARSSVVQAITLVPQYKDSYKLAERIQTLSPDKDFEKYVTDMENKYLIQP